VRHSTTWFALLAAALTASSPGWADEGQWLPSQLSQLGSERLQRLGLKIPTEQLWNGTGGLLQAAVNYSGCSAGFVSKDGLIVTNHHCAYPAIQALSTPAQDRLSTGYLARSRADELPAQGRGEVDVLAEISDVTTMVRDAIDMATDDLARFEAAEAAKTRIAETCQSEHAGHRCEVYEYAFGTAYRLVRTFHIRDVRLVYAPPASVWEFGGEVDNWSWPRHTGDFAMLRAYVAPDGTPADYAPDNVPYRPAVFFPVSDQGVSVGDFVAVTGYPGRTDRYWPAAEVARYRNQVFPAIVGLYDDWVTLLDRVGRKSKRLSIKTAALQKNLANRLKNARGMVAGLDRMDLVARKEKREARLPDTARPVLTDAAALTEAASKGFRTGFLLDSLERGPNLLAIAYDLGRLALSTELSSGQVDPRYAERNREVLWAAQERRLRDYDIAIDRPWMADLLLRLRKANLLPPRLRRAPLSTPKGRNRVAQGLLSRTRLNREAFVRRFFDEPSLPKLEAAKDPLLRLGLFLARKAEASATGARRVAGGWLRVGPKYLALMNPGDGRPVYPDANRTLRVSVAQVRGYIVEDGLQAIAQTTLSGQLAKVTGEPPFELPVEVRNAARNRIHSRFTDRDLSDVPMCFLSTADTTGGNSGSPVIDGQGRLVGLNFDRVWENVAGDFAYNPAWSRNISVDIRYLLWTLEEVAGAHNLITEMGVGVRAVE
jgi:hypothetical protein